MQEKTSILLVGPCPENFLDLGKIADHLGMEFLPADTYEQALEYCNEGQIALMIAGAALQLVPGEPLIDALRADYDMSQIPVILIGEEPADLIARSADEAPVDVLPLATTAYMLSTRIRLLTEWYVQRRRIEVLESENERLDALNKQVRKFVGNVAHDLRGPLGKLINTAEVLISGVEPEALSTFYEMLVQTSRRGYNLVNDILDITALESGQLQLFFDKCDLGEIAAQVFDELGYLAERKQLQLVNAVARGQWVRGDRRRIYQVLGNLLNNAIKFTPRGGQIAIEAQSRPQGIWVCVNDTGVGIAPDKLQTLFLKHVKNSTPGTEGEQGTGFGLPLAQEIAMAHNATIEATSEEGKGSSFCFQLPYWSPVDEA